MKKSARVLVNPAAAWPPAPAPAPARTAQVPAGWLALGAAASLCLALWTAPVRLLVGAEAREGGRVLACRYLAGAVVVERQYLNTGRAGDRRACPVVRIG